MIPKKQQQLQSSNTQSSSTQQTQDKYKKKYNTQISNTLNICKLINQLINYSIKFKFISIH